MRGDAWALYEVIGNSSVAVARRGDARPATDMNPLASDVFDAPCMGSYRTLLMHFSCKDLYNALGPERALAHNFLIILACCRHAASTGGRPRQEAPLVPVEPKRGPFFVRDGFVRSHPQERSSSQGVKFLVIEIGEASHNSANVVCPS